MTGRTAPVWAYTCYNADTAVGVLSAAEKERRDVILLVSAKMFAGGQGRALMRCLRTLADDSSVTVHIQLDHVSDLAVIDRAFAAGAHAVMADGSRMPFEENIAFVHEAVTVARSHGGWVEAELGALPGDEDLALDVLPDQDGHTPPGLVREFVERTGADCLAVAFGNLHGAYAEPPRLDWELLSTLVERSRVPLSLHGASGISAPDIRRAVGMGIRKINVNTELRERCVADLLNGLDAARRGYDVMSLTLGISAGAADVARGKFAMA
jgi:tagatose 1,6-diphosphate aldolase GatY/KbaY